MPVIGSPATPRNIDNIIKIFTGNRKNLKWNMLCMEISIPE